MKSSLSVVSVMVCMCGTYGFFLSFVAIRCVLSVAAVAAVAIAIAVAVKCVNRGS